MRALNLHTGVTALCIVAMAFYPAQTHAQASVENEFHVAETGLRGRTPAPILDATTLDGAKLDAPTLDTATLDASETGKPTQKAFIKPSIVSATPPSATDANPVLLSARISPSTVPTTSFRSPRALSTPINRSYALGTGLIARLATIYAQFQIDVRDSSKNDYGSFDEIRASLLDMGGLNPDQSAGASVAFAAVIVSKDARFRSAVLRESGRTGKAAYLASLAKQPYPVLYLDGAKAAIHKASEIVKTDFRYVEQAGLVMKESSYLLQNNSWARKNISGKSALMSELDQHINAQRNADMSVTQALNSKVSMQQVRSGIFQRLGLAQALEVAQQTTRSTPASSGRIGKVDSYYDSMIGALAAYLVLGEDTPQNSANIRKILNVDLENKLCLEMAQLNLQQCTAAMHKTYEIPYCIGEHALIEVAACYN